MQTIANDSSTPQLLVTDRTLSRLSQFLSSLKIIRLICVKREQLVVHCGSNIWVQDRRNRTLHLHEVTWPTNLLIFRFSRANAEMSHNVRVGAGGCRDIVGSGKFSHGVVRPQRPPLLVPLYSKQLLCSYSKPTCVILMDMRRIPTSPNSQLKASTTSQNQQTSKQTNKYIPLPNPAVLLSIFNTYRQGLSIFQ